MQSLLNAGKLSCCLLLALVAGQVSAAPVPSGSSTSTHLVAAAPRGSCQRCGKRILLGRTCTRCKLSGARDKTSEAARKLSSNASRAASKTREATRRASDSVRATAGRLAPEVKRSLRSGAEATSNRVRNSVDNGFDRLRNKAGTAQERAQKTAQKVRAAALAKQQSLLESLRSTRQETAHKFEEYLREVPSSSAAAIIDRLRDYEHRFGLEAAGRIASVYADRKQYLTPQLEQILSKAGTRMVALAGDPSNRKRAVDAVVAALEVKHRIDAYQDKALERVVDTIGNDVQVPIDGHTASLNDWARLYITRHHPYLRGTSVEDDPVETLVFALVAPDTKYLMTELRVVRLASGEVLTPAQCLQRSTGTNPDQTLAALDAIERTVRLRKALASGQDVIPSAVEFGELMRDSVGGRR